MHPGTDELPAFSVVPPEGRESPVVVEVPHAGTMMDPESLAACVASARSIGQDADLYVSELFSRAPRYGAHLLYSRMSRYVCDLNREESELDAQTVSSGTAVSSPHGVVWRKSTEGRPAIASPLTTQEVERRLSAVYRPYHQALYELVQEKRSKFGYAILLCGHSMPSFGRLGERRADVVPGSRGRTTAGPAVIQVVEKVAHRANYAVAHDTPYRGGFTTGHYGSPSHGIHAIQIELARRLYMNEVTLARTHEPFEKCQAFCSALVRELSELELEPGLGNE